MDPNLGNVQNVLVDVSNLCHALSQELGCKDVRKITESIFLKVTQETLAEWMMDFVLDLKRCDDVLKTTSGKIDDVMSLQGTKLQKQEQLLEENSRAVKYFQSTLTAEELSR